MKQLLYSLVFCCLAVLSFTACEQENEFGEREPVATANSIILDLSSSVPAQVAAVGVEVRVEHLDVLIFPQLTGDNQNNSTLVWHERVNVQEANQGKVTLAANRNIFEVDKRYYVYLIANSTEQLEEFKVGEFTLSKLKALDQVDREIHVTGLPEATDVPQSFLMDGIARLKDSPASDDAVVLNDGDPSANTELEVTLKRAAAKILVKINKGEHVQFDTDPFKHNAGYYLRNMPYQTSVISTTEAVEPLLRTPDLGNHSYFDWKSDMITVTAYAYAHDWNDKSPLENEVRLIVNIPLTYTPEGSTEGTFYENSYYQIPVSESKMLKRNTCYEVNVTVDAPGANNPSDPVKLTGISYRVGEWQVKTINVGGEEDRPAFLTLNEYEMEMYNLTEDNTTLEFASSSAVTAEVIEVWYIDKFGQKKNLQKKGANNPDGWGEQYSTGSLFPSTAWKNECTITVTPDPGLNGKLDVFSDLPENNTIRYIKIKVTNGEKIEREVVVAQYPLEYITSIQGWYSYRSDFGGTTFETKGDRTTNNSYFKSKVAEEITSGNNKGKSNIYRYYWSRSSSTVNGRYESVYAGNSPGNARMYHVVISATSSTYTLGIPRLDAEGYTERSAANNVIVSPSFMLASQLGALTGTVTFNQARDHCLQYVETYKDENNKVVHLEDWRLPTRAELEIIIKFQYSSDAMDEVIRRRGYWCADGDYVYNQQGQTGNGYIRCIRDAYDTEK